MHMLLHGMMLNEYPSAGMVETDPEGALAGFDAVVRMEPEKAEWLAFLPILLHYSVLSAISLCLLQHNMNAQVYKVSYLISVLLSVILKVGA